MKIKSLVILSAAFVSMSVSAQTSFEKLEANKDINTVVVSQKMFQMLSKIDSKDADAKEFMGSIEPEGDNVFFYVDPPYIVQGEQLYLNSLTYQNHLDLAEYLHDISAPWILTYDVANQVTDELYKDLRVAKFNISHTVQKQHVGSEYIVYGNNVKVPNLNMLVQANGEWVHK